MNIKKTLQNLQSRLNLERFSNINQKHVIGILLFALISTLILTRVRAIAPFISFEAESAGNNVIVKKDTAASGGQYAEFTARQDVDHSFSGDVLESAGFTVPAGEVWQFDPNNDTTVEVENNVIVLGTLQMRPNPGVKHTLRFLNVDESAFVGGGMELIESDTGLWVMQDGKLDIHGEKKAGWNRTGTDPTWKPNDELIVAPIEYGNFDFKPFTPGSNVPRLDPSLPPTEVMNLTRSVNIEGTPDGYAHIMFMSSQPQIIKHASFRYLGVDNALGRYPLHFHFMGDASRGSIIEGTVVRDANHHAYVAHASHGVTFRDTVAYNVLESAYWWDPVKGTGSMANSTNDIVYEHAIAANINKLAAQSIFGFFLVAGEGGVVKDSVAVGVQGSTEAGGYAWPPNDLQVWEFDNNVAHNNTPNGIWIWHNDKTDHLISNFVAYSNGNPRGTGAGIDSGAYNQNYSFTDVYLFGNATAIQLHAGSAGTQTWTNITMRDNLRAFEISDSSNPNWPVPFACLTIDGQVQQPGAIDPRLDISGC